MASTLPKTDRIFSHFMRLLYATSVATVLIGYFWRGLDFALAALLGSLIVGINLIWTRNVVRKALASGQPRPHFIVSVLLKFAVSVAVLFFAILRFNMDPLGILAGISALLLTSILVGLVRYGF